MWEWKLLTERKLLYFCRFHSDIFENIQFA